MSPRFQEGGHGMTPFAFLSQKHDLLKLIIIATLLAALLFGSLQPLFAQSPDTSHLPALEKAFWSRTEYRDHFPNGNALYDFAGIASQEKRREIGAYLSKLAHFPKYIPLDALHEYVYVALAPTRTTGGIAIVGVPEGEEVRLVQIPLKPASSKLSPDFAYNIWIDELGDAKGIGKYARSRFLMHIVHQVEEASLPAYRDWNESIFYSAADVQEYDLTATIDGKTYRAKSTHARTALPFEVELRPVRQLVGDDIGAAIPMARNPIQIKTIVHFSDRTRSTASKEFDYYTKNPVIRAHRPARISVAMPSELLETQTFPVSDHTSARAKKQVYIDDVLLSELETKKFFRGEYLFPLVGKDKIYRIAIVYTSGDNDSDKVVFADNVLVYTVRPYLQIATQGVHKAGRMLTTTASWGLSSFAERYVTVPTPRIEVNAAQKIKTTQTRPSQIQFYLPETEDADKSVRIAAHTKISVSKGVVQRQIPDSYLSVSSAPYELQITQDAAPAIFALPTLFSFPRGSAPEVLIKTSSLDGDEIQETKYVLKKRENSGLRIVESGTLPIKNNTQDTTKQSDTKHNTGATRLSLPKLELGTYELVILGKEKAVGEIVPGAPEKESKKVVTFSVQNQAPVTQMRIRRNMNLPPFDIVVTTKDALYSDVVSQHRLNVANALRENGFDIAIHHKDLALHTDTKYIEHPQKTGTHYPEETYAYDRDGYRGILSRYDVSSETTVVEGGHFVSVEESETVEELVPNRSGGAAVFKWTNGSWICVKPWQGVLLPDTRVRDCPGGGKVVLRKVGAINNSMEAPPHSGTYEGETYTIPFDWSAVYNGVCTRTVQVWEPSTTTMLTYTGYYKGDVTSTLQNAYLEMLRIPTTKIEIDFSDSEPTRESLHALILEALRKEIPETNVVLVDEEIRYEIIDRDPEQDPIEVMSISYRHDPSIFDNPAEDASFSGAELAQTLSKPGKYHITREIRDLPPALSEEHRRHSKSSVDLVVHRKPVARFESRVKEITEQDGQEIAALSFVDMSYDLDYQVSDEKRGIVQRMYRYRLFDPAHDKVEEDGTILNGIGTTIAESPSEKDGSRSEDSTSALQGIESMPDTLPVGKYVVSLIVRDKHGAWSDEYARLLDATKVDAVELSASLRGLGGYETTAIPAGERLQLYEVRSKYEDRHHLTYHFPGFSKQWAFEDARALGGDRYAWNDWEYEIPSTTPDGSYQAKVVGTPSGVVTLPYVVSTPIHIKGEVSHGSKIELSALTSKYASRTKVTAFTGTPYETTLEMQSDGMHGTEKKWKAELDLSGQDLSSGTYRFDFWTTTEAGKTATDTKQKQIELLSIENVSIKGSWNKWNTARFLGYEKIKVQVTTRGKADAVSIRFSPELEAMVYKNSKGDTYRYVDEFGYTVSFPLSLSKVQSQGSTEVWEVSYILPIAPSTIDWKNKRIRPSYALFVEAKKASSTVTHTGKLDITGNVHDLMYIRPGAGNESTR